MSALSNDFARDFTPEFVQKLFDKIDALTTVISQQTATIEKLTETIKTQQEEIFRLKEQLNKNSKNSSKPPSSDGFNKPGPKSLRKSTGKKQGAQKGHVGKGFTLIKEPNETLEHIPTACNGCPDFGSCVSCSISAKRYEVDIIIDTKVTLHKTLSYQCPKLGNRVITGTFPSHINSAMQYGNNLQALAVSLNTLGMVSINRTHDLLSGLFNIPISTGTIHKMVTDYAKKVQPTVEKIREKIEKASVAHFDETGIRVDKTNYWTHSASTTDLTYLSLQAKRGFEGMEASRVLPYFNGIAVHDCWLSYWKYTNIMHAVCCAHLLRELTGIIENAPTQIWAKEMLDLLLKMKEVRDKAVYMDKEKLSYYYMNGFHKDYLRIIEAGRHLNPIPEKKKGKRGRHGKGKIRSLIERLFDYKESVCLFTKNFSVPFDNNQAERDIRMIKVKTKVSGCFRTTEGAESFLTIMSYLGTAKKRGIRPMLALQKVFSGDGDSIFSE